MSNPTQQLNPSCPKCHCKSITRRGKRRNRLRTLQLFQCTECLHRFTGEPGKSRTYQAAFFFSSDGRVAPADTVVGLGGGPLWDFITKPAAGVNAIAVQADARDDSEVEAAVKETAKSLGRLDILINMASTYVKTPNPTEADWSDAIDSNAKHERLPV